MLKRGWIRTSGSMALGGKRADAYADKVFFKNHQPALLNIPFKPSPANSFIHITRVLVVA